MTLQSIKKEATGLDYLAMALYAFAGLAIEMVVLVLEEQVIYGNTYNEWSIMQGVFHWLITSIIWGIVIFFLVRLAASKYKFNLFAKAKPMKKVQWILVLICSILVIGFKYYDWEGFKFLKEYISQGTLKFIFLYIYYFFEVGLFMLIIVFGQKAFEVWFKKANIPYGGIVVAITWGLAHCLTQGDIITGLFTAFSGFIFGYTYLLVNRDIRKTYILLFIMFIL